MTHLNQQPHESELLYFLELYDLSQDRKRPRNPLSFRHEKRMSQRSKARPRRALPAELE